MPNTLQDFLVIATQKASADLVAAFLRLPEDKRGWSPGEKSRTALDQMVECATLNGYMADLIQTRTWPTDTSKAEAVAQDWETLHAWLQENTDRLIAAIAVVPDEALTQEMELPWQKMPLTEVIARAYWNMTYHEGQINYIASILGCLN